MKKEYDYTRAKTKDNGIKLGRFYRDFQDFLEHNPNASIVEMDTVIGTQGGKGGKCFLTLLFRSFNLMVIKVKTLQDFPGYRKKPLNTGFPVLKGFSSFTHI